MTPEAIKAISDAVAGHPLVKRRSDAKGTSLHVKRGCYTWDTLLSICAHVKEVVDLEVGITCFTPNFAAVGLDGVEVYVNRK